MKDLNHFEYTSLATEMYYEYTNTDMNKGTFRQSLAQGSQDEDKFNPLGLDFQRVFNWHFYNNNGSISDNHLVPGSRTSEERVQSLIKKIKKYKSKYRDASEDDKDDILERLIDATGRLIHHIQDMSTFSHVVPVYHGPGLKDNYEVFGAKFVNKIKVVLQDEKKTNSIYITISPDEIKETMEKYIGQSLIDIYNLSAKKTLEILNSDNYRFELTINGESKKLKWNSFWKERNNIEPHEYPALEKKYEDFGNFGELCNNFGEPFFTVGDVFYEVNHYEYMKIYKKMMKKSILDTVAIINIVFSDL